MKCNPFNCSREKFWRSLLLAAAQIALALLIALSPSQPGAQQALAGAVDDPRDIEQRRGSGSPATSKN